MNKFIEEFQKQTKGKFNMLKFKNAEYFKDTHILRVQFNVSTFEIKSLTDSDHQEIQSAVENLFPNTEVHIDLNRTYADEK
ncbi:MAG: hypothetical protein PHE93_02465, partial [Clostridia bacterium]|nr:hypothetical protein [Clostridia bacterium]